MPRGHGTTPPRPHSDSTRPDPDLEPAPDPPPPDPDPDSHPDVHSDPTPAGPWTLLTLMNVGVLGLGEGRTVQGEDWIIP